MRELFNNVPTAAEEEHTASKPSSSTTTIIKKKLEQKTFQLAHTSDFPLQQIAQQPSPPLVTPHLNLKTKQQAAANRGRKKKKAQLSGQEVSRGHPEGQTDGPRRKDAGGEDASVTPKLQYNITTCLSSHPVCLQVCCDDRLIKHEAAAGDAAASALRSAQHPRRQGHGGLKSPESRVERVLCASCLRGKLDTMTANASPLPPAGLTWTCTGLLRRGAPKPRERLPGRGQRSGRRAKREAQGGATKVPVVREVSGINAG